MNQVSRSGGIPDADESPVLTIGPLRILAVNAEARLYVGPRPFEEDADETTAMEAIETLARLGGVTAIVDLNADEAERVAAEGPLTYRGSYVEDDGKALAPAVLESASRIVRELLDSGHRVYLHCTLGKGRSPTVAAAYLIACRGMRASAAREHIEGLDSKWFHRGIWRGYDARFPGRLQEFEERVRRKSNGGDRG